MSRKNPQLLIKVVSTRGQYKTGNVSTPLCTALRCHHYHYLTVIYSIYSIAVNPRVKFDRWKVNLFDLINALSSSLIWVFFLSFLSSVLFWTIAYKCQSNWNVFILFLILDFFCALIIMIVCMQNRSVTHDLEMAVGD